MVTEKIKMGGRTLSTSGYCVCVAFLQDLLPCADASFTETLVCENFPQTALDALIVSQPRIFIGFFFFLAENSLELEGCDMGWHCTQIPLPGDRPEPDGCAPPKY